MDRAPSTSYSIIALAPTTISRLIQLCEREASRLQKFSLTWAYDPESKDDVAAAENDASFWTDLAQMLKDIRDAKTHEAPQP